MPGMGRWVGPSALYEEEEAAARKQLYNGDAAGARQTVVLHNIEGGRREGAI